MCSFSLYSLIFKGFPKGLLDEACSAKVGHFGFACQVFLEFFYQQNYQHANPVILYTIPF